MVNFSCCEIGLKKLFYQQSKINNIINEFTLKDYWEHMKECETCLESYSEFQKSLPPTMKIIVNNFMRGLK